MAKECYEKSATGQERTRSPWHAAKNLEKAGEMAKELRDWSGVQDCYNRAADFYCEEGRQSNAAEALARGALLLEEHDAQTAAVMYGQAVAHLEDSGKDVIAGDTYRQAISHLLRNQQWSEAVVMLLRFAVSCDKAGAASSQCKAYLGAVIVHLYGGDAKQAWNTFQDAMNVDIFSSSDEAFAADALFDAYRTADADAITGVIKANHIFTALDSQIVRLVKKLPGDKTDLAKMASMLGGKAVAGLGEEEEEDLT